MATVTRYVDPDATGTGTGVDYTNAYTSLSAWEAAEQTNLVSDGDIHIVNVQSSGGTADTAAVTIAGWTTGVSNDISINSDDGASNASYNTSLYRLEVNDANALNIQEDYVSIENLQISSTRTSSNNITVVNITGVTSNNLTFIKSCRIRGVTGFSGWRCLRDSDTDSNLEVKDCIIYNAQTDILLLNVTTALIYNCTIYNGTVDGIDVDGGDVTVKNTIVFQTATDFVGTMTIDYCASDDGNGTNAIAPQGGSWANELESAATGDFSNTGDGNTALAGVGNDDDSEVTLTDIDGDERPTPFVDIGADEFDRTHFYVDTDVAGGVGDGSSWTDAYSSLAAWESAEQSNLVTATERYIVFVRALSGSADTTNFAISGWTTSVDYYVHVFGVVPLQPEWDTTIYRMSRSNQHGMRAREDFVIYENLQVEVTSVNSDDKDSVMRIDSDQGAGAVIEIKGCVLKGGNDNSNFQSCVYVNDAQVTVNIYNTLMFNILGSAVVLYDAATGGSVDSCTIADGTDSVIDVSGNVVVDNCILYNAVNDPPTDVTDGNYNSTDKTSVSDDVGYGGANDRVSQTFTFNATTDNYELMWPDGGAKEYGATNLEVDLSRLTRPYGVDDIGCNESRRGPYSFVRRHR